MNKTNIETKTGEGIAPRGEVDPLRETLIHVCPKCGSSALETCVTILVCNGVGRKQAFRRGSHLIGYGDTEQQAIENLISKGA